MRKKSFILSEHMVGLTILIVGILFFLTTMKGFTEQRKRMEEKLIASRICSEYGRSHYFVHEAGYRLAYDSQGMVVFHQGNEVLRIEKQ